MVGVAHHLVLVPFIKSFVSLFYEDRCAFETFNEFLLVHLLNLRKGLYSLSALLFQEYLLGLVPIR